MSEITILPNDIVHFEHKLCFGLPQKFLYHGREYSLIINP